MDTTAPPKIGVSLISAVAAYAAVSYLRAAPALRSVPEGPVAPGEIRVAPPGRGFSLVLPKGWVNVDTNSPKFIESRKARLDQFNQTRGTHVPFNATGEALYAYDGATAHDPITRTVGIRIKDSRFVRTDPQKTAVDLGNRLTKDIPGVKVFQAEAVDLPVGKVPRVVSSFPFLSAKLGTLATTIVTYSLRDHDRLITMTITGMEKDRTEVTALGEHLAASFRSLR